MSEAQKKDSLASDPELVVRSWDRQARESARAFWAFTHYRGLAKERTTRSLENGEWKERQQSVELDVSSITKLMHVGARMERSARGDPEDGKQYAKVEIIIQRDDPPPDDPETVRKLQEAQISA